MCERRYRLPKGGTAVVSAITEDEQLYLQELASDLTSSLTDQNYKNKKTLVGITVISHHSSHLSFFYTSMAVHIT